MPDPKNLQPIWNRESTDNFNFVLLRIQYIYRIRMRQSFQCISCEVLLFRCFIYQSISYFDCQLRFSERIRVRSTRTNDGYAWLPQTRIPSLSDFEFDSSIIPGLLADRRETVDHPAITYIPFTVLDTCVAKFRPFPTPFIGPILKDFATSQSQ